MNLKIHFHLRLLKQTRSMIILAVETSCDDTGVSIIKVRNSKINILSNIVSSQIKIHKKYGGVFPSLAKREHQKNLPIVLKKALAEAKNPKVDLVAVTKGPGLEPCLWAGFNFTKELAEKMKKPLVLVNHIESHILVNWLELRNKKDIFPAMALVVSGGHTILILMKGIGKYKIIGETKDDAAGECFDKVARILELGYPGGPIIDKKAEEQRSRGIPPKFKVELPRPMIYQKNYDFSFSGLKTAVLYEFRSKSQKIRKSNNYITEMCLEVQKAIIDVLIKKTMKAAKDFRVKSVILGGGVVASKELKKRFQESGTEAGFKVIYPSAGYCTDNAVMTAITAFFHQGRKTKNWKTIKVNANLKIG